MNQDMQRYSRQQKIIGTLNQKKLSSKRVIIVGCGGLGSAAAELLLRAGVENLTLIDKDKIELSNLGRQLMYGQKDIGKYKAHAAKKELLRINPHANITIITRELNSKSLSLLKQDLVLDCTDNLETRFWINEYCHKNKIPWIYASAIRWEGYVMLISPHGPCLSCFIKSDVNHNYVNKTCTQQGIISPLPASIATLQTSLALRYLIGEKIEPLLYHLNLHTLSLSQLKVKKKNNCPTCSKVR